jgi:hypothetical protein
MGVEYPVETALRSDVQPLIGQSRHDLPGGSEAYSTWLQVSRMRCRSSSLSLCDIRRGLPLRRSWPPPSPIKAFRHRLSVRRQMPISLQALAKPAPAEWASLISSIALRR